jgi:hypothetical protein
MSDPDILALARAARAKGYDSIERVVARLTALIKHNERYVATRREIQTAYVTQTIEDDQVIALAIVLLESTES